MASAGSIGVFLLLTITATSIVCLLTGYARRSYPTLGRSTSVVVAGNTISLEQLASSFQPQLFLPASVNSPPALTMWWEAIDADDSIALVYHPIWQDEWHPSPVLHWIYYIYRIIVYGIPVRDIEYIQINVNRSDGIIQRIRYEGSFSKSYGDWINEHRYITINRIGSQYIETTHATRNSKPQDRTVKISGSRLHFGIATWSHQFVLLEGNPQQYIVPVHMALAHLSEDDYTRYKLARRSQGDFVTKESIVSIVAKSIIRTLILGLPYIFLQFTYRETDNSRA